MKQKPLYSNHIDDNDKMLMDDRTELYHCLLYWSSDQIRMEYHQSILYQPTLQKSDFVKTKNWFGSAET